MCQKGTVFEFNSTDVQHISSFKGKTNAVFEFFGEMWQILWTAKNWESDIHNIFTQIDGFISSIKLNKDELNVNMKKMKKCD